MHCDVWFNPRTPKVKIHLRTPKGGGHHNHGFLPSSENFLKISRMGMFSGSRNPTMIMKKLYLYCMTLKIKVKHPFEWPLLSLAVNVVQIKIFDLGVDSNVFGVRDVQKTKMNTLTLTVDIENQGQTYVPVWPLLPFAVNMIQTWSWCRF